MKKARHRFRKFLPFLERTRRGTSGTPPIDDFPRPHHWEETYAKRGRDARYARMSETENFHGHESDLVIWYQGYVVGSAEKKKTDRPNVAAGRSSRGRAVVP